MRVPRDVSADRLIHALKRLGYVTVRQKGSHIRLMHVGPPRHLITVPAHNPIKTGTLHVLTTDVAQQRSISLDELIKML